MIYLVTFCEGEEVWYIFAKDFEKIIRDLLDRNLIVVKLPG
ncbi:hypothetical protein [Carboxydothermus pertinax]|uniref:Uncharacterized protein n=1 Tax=Carboxydothermus pertinax TaxID=870242 RepID=A0A1L8CU72_9THEO|nr:hypothetical protein [Carboxydothermus pertinax]GAV22466.1 hypothetical protein cpu_09760 [Carboxydothermus pertinax]